MLREMYNRNYLTDVFGSVHIVFTAIPLLDLLYPWIALQMNELVIYRVARPIPSLPPFPSYHGPKVHAGRVPLSTL